MNTQPQKGDRIAKGKTKSIWVAVNRPGLAIFSSEDDITAGDGAQHEVLQTKGYLANRTTCNVFHLLQKAGIQVAWNGPFDETSFIGPWCQMLKYEVVVRRLALGSHLKRNPGTPKGKIFKRLEPEFYLKTCCGKWCSNEFPESPATGRVINDPFMAFSDDGKQIGLFDPAIPIAGSEPFLILDEEEVYAHGRELFDRMGEITKEVFLVLEKAWQLLGLELADFKIEFGIDQGGRLLVADVIDNDSWRLLDGGRHMDKQLFRDGGQLSDVLEKYRTVASLTDRFQVPDQQLVVWRASEKDDVSGIEDALIKYLGKSMPITVTPVTLSAHKQAPACLTKLEEVTRACPNTVILAYVGMSNGLGPMLSGHTMAPVINVPATADNYPEDISSSLRLPSDVPASTVLSPANAVLNGLQILANHNPIVYARLQRRLEERAFVE